MSTHNLCFEQKYEKYQNFLSENFQFLVVQFSVYLNRHVFVMYDILIIDLWPGTESSSMTLKKVINTVEQNVK